MPFGVKSRWDPWETFCASVAGDVASPMPFGVKSRWDVIKNAYKHVGANLSPMPFGVKSRWDHRPLAGQGFRPFLLSPMPFGVKSRWDRRVMDAPTTFTARSPMPFGVKSRWDVRHYTT